MCKKKEDFKKIKSLRDGGSKDVEDSRNVA